MKHRFNFRMGIFSVCILLLVSLTACAGPAQHAQDQGGQDADALHLAEYAAYIGLPRAQALDALGLQEEDLEKLDESPNAGLYRVRDHDVLAGGSAFEMLVRFEGDLAEPAEGEYLYSVSYRLPIDGQTEEELFYAVAALQDMVMKVCGRPRTYWMDGGLSTEIIVPGMLNPEQEFGYIDRWLVSEEGSYPGDADAGGSVIMAALDIRNEQLDIRSPQWQHIQLQLTFRTEDSLQGPKVNGEPMYDYIFL